MTEPTCRVCGCTELNACPGPCFWVESDLCSACPGGRRVPPPEHAQAVTALAEAIASEHRERWDPAAVAAQCMRELQEAQHGGLVELLMEKGVFTLDELMQAEAQAIRCQAEQRPGPRFLVVSEGDEPESEDLG